MHTCNEPAARLVEGEGEDPSLRLEGAGLRDRLQRAKVVPCLVVPHVDVARVTARRHDIVGVDGERMHDAVVAIDIVHETSLRVLPLFHVVGRGGDEAG